MVDFKKRLGKATSAAVTHPCEIYGGLDRATDKGPLRPAQEAVLIEWFEARRGDRDVIVKLHTGQGKTLIGLLMLQSRLNESKEPVLYLVPNNFLIDQTCEHARQFGIATCQATPDLPDDFLNGRKILVTSVQKLFTGVTKFGLGRKSLPVGTLLMDDAHACSDDIREACRIRIPRDDAAYDALKDLFADALEQQGIGTYADIGNKKRDALLPVPYWAWADHVSDVAQILSAGTNRNAIRFAWPLVKDILPHCQCVVSGVAIEIEPYMPPLESFGTYWKARHRIFMSATVTDDAFLVKGLQLTPDTITNPLKFDKESWSGEKMVLLPSLIHEDLNRDEAVALFAKSENLSQHGGIVVLVTAFDGRNTKDWQRYGATVATKETLRAEIDRLRQGQYDPPLVLVNRYDGIDLPDNMCRILVIDGQPYSESLIDLHEEHCRPTSEATQMRMARTFEQGMGRR